MARKSYNKHGVFGGTQHGKSCAPNLNYSISPEFIAKNKRIGKTKLDLIEKHLDNLTPEDVSWFHNMKTAYKDQHCQLSPKQNDSLNRLIKKCNSTIYQKPVTKFDLQKIRRLVGIKAP